MILQTLPHGQSSIKSQLKTNSAGSKGCPASPAECLFLAHGHWTWRWQNENRRDEYTSCKHSKRGIMPASSQAPCLLFTLLLIHFSTGRQRGWMEGDKAKDGGFFIGTHVSTYCIPHTVLYTFPLLDNIFLIFFCLTIFMIAIIPIIDAYWVPGSRGGLCDIQALKPPCKCSGQSHELYFYKWSIWSLGSVSNLPKAT